MLLLCWEVGRFMEEQGPIYYLNGPELAGMDIQIETRETIFTRVS